MLKKHILCGFDLPEFETQMKILLQGKGYEAVTYTQLSKKGVKDFLLQNPQVDTVILLEASNHKKSYTAEEVAALTDKRDLNLIIVLSARHIGTDYMKTLYIAGVTNAIFQMGRKDGASPKEIVELILNKRNRAEARKYYGIEHMEMGPTAMIDRDTYAEIYSRLHQDKNLLLNYFSLCADMTPKQIADFTKRLPCEDRAVLAQYEEFHMLMDAVRKLGIEIKSKRPKKVKIGLKVPPQIMVAGDSICFGNTEELFHMNAPKVTEELYGGLSMEELLIAAEQEEATKDPFLAEKEDVRIKEEAEVLLERARRIEEEAKHKEEALLKEQERLKKERQAFEDAKKAVDVRLQEEKRCLEDSAQEVINKASDTKAEEEKCRKRREKEEIERRRWEEKERARKKELYLQEDEVELITSDKQFSGGFLLLLLLLCAGVIGCLFAMPYLSRLRVW